MPDDLVVGEHSSRSTWAITMTPGVRKLALTVHVTSSVGWLGAVVAYLALAITGLTSEDAQMVRGAYLAMELMGWFVIVPFGLASLLTGLVMSLGTPWGLIRHYWVLAKLLLTVFAVCVLLKHMQVVSQMARLAAETTLSSADFHAPRLQLVVHAGAGLLVLLVATTLSVFKPWGKTRYGRPEQTPSIAAVDRESTTSTPWTLYVVLGVIGLILLFAVLHLTGGAPRH